VKDDFRRAFRLDRLSRADARAKVDDELELHIDLMVEELVSAGWAPEAARAEAIRQFGDMDHTRRYCADIQTRRGRGERRAMSFDELRQDLRYALRTLRTAPGYAGLVVLTLAFGIAANTAVFSVMNPFLFRPLPYGDPAELVQVNQVDPVTGWDMARLSYPQYEDWKARSRAFQDLAAYEYGSANVTGPEGPERVQYARLTANLLSVLRASPMLGRGFSDVEGSPGGEPVVVMSESLWARRYNGDPGLVGRTVSLDGVQHTVIGIMPRLFNFPFGSAKMWIPLRGDASSPRANGNYQLVGRLSPGWTPERAREELTEIQRSLSAQYPDIDGRMAGVTVKPLREALNFAWEILNVTFLVLLGAMAFVLLIACVNVASLTLARGSGRLREVAVRSALGARRGRIVRQLFTESLVLAGLGGLVGVGLSYWIAGMLDPVLPEDLYKIGRVDLDGTVLAFSALVTLATPVAFGLLPAVTSARSELAAGLKEGSKGSGGLGTSRGRRALVVAQVALAVVLITGAGLMLRSFARVQAIDLGFDADRLLVAEAILPAGEYASPQERLAFVERAVSELRRVPAIASASAITALPLNHETHTFQVAPPEMAGLPGEEWPLSVINYAYPGYFETTGIALLAGRTFEAQDGPEAPGVVVVNRSLARRFWPNESAVGKTLLAGNDPSDPGSYTVIGVVADIRHSGLSGGEVGPQMYRPALQHRARRYFLLSRTEGPPSAAVPAVRQALRSADSDLPVEIRSMTSVVRENQLQWSLSTAFLGIFGGGALLLASLGIYGLISFSVAQRRRELGVRIALGATRGEIRKVVVGDGLRLTAFGLVLGLAAALALSRLLASVLYGVSSSDPLTLAGVLALFLGVAGVASYVPAERASRTDPVGVLKSE
jgi:predicted permease